MRGPDHGNSEKLRRSIRKTHADGPNHTHDLKASDLRKRPTEVTEFIEAEAAKAYRPPVIKNVAEQHFGGKQIVSSSFSSKAPAMLRVRHED